MVPFSLGLSAKLVAGLAISRSFSPSSPTWIAPSQNSDLSHNIISSERDLPSPPYIKKVTPTHHHTTITAPPTLFAITVLFLYCICHNLIFKIYLLKYLFCFSKCTVSSMRADASSQMNYNNKWYNKCTKENQR